jgi:hypothetical protein
MFHAAGYELPPPTPTWVAALVGRAVHYGAELLLKAKIKKETLSLEKAMSKVSTFLKSDIAKSAESSEPAQFTNEIPSPNAAEIRAFKLLRLYHEKMYPFRDPKLVEERLVAPIFSGVTISATLDQLTTNDIVCDLKTGNKISSAHCQLGAQASVCRHHGMTVSGGQLDVVNTAGSGGSAQAYSVEYDIDNAIIVMKDTVAHMAANIRAFEKHKKLYIFNTNPAADLCSKFTCRLHGSDLCNAWRAK